MARFLLGIAPEHGENVAALVDQTNLDIEIKLTYLEDYLTVNQMRTCKKLLQGKASNFLQYCYSGQIRLIERMLGNKDYSSIRAIIVGLNNAQALEAFQNYLKFNEITETEDEEEKPKPGKDGKKQEPPPKKEESEESEEEEEVSSLSEEDEEEEPEPRKPTPKKEEKKKNREKKELAEKKKKTTTEMRTELEQKARAECSQRGDEIRKKIKDMEEVVASWKNEREEIAGRQAHHGRPTPAPAQTSD